MAPGEEKEGKLLKVAGIATALAAVIALPIAGFDLYDKVASLQDTVDYQALELDNQRKQLANQERQIELQQAAMEQQEQQFQEYVDLTSPHYMDEAIERRLVMLDQAIDDAEAEREAEAASQAASFDSATADGGDRAIE